MSDTKRNPTPGWNPANPDWCSGEMTEKYQFKDKSAGKYKFSKNHRFMLGTKNSKYNLEQKNEQLSLQEHLTE